MSLWDPIPQQPTEEDRSIGQVLAELVLLMLVVLVVVLAFGDESTSVLGFSSGTVPTPTP